MGVYGAVLGRVPEGGSECLERRQRACLEQGLKLDINRLARQGVLDANRAAGPSRIEWTNTYTGEEVASGTITADMEGPDEGWLRESKSESLTQRIDLRAMPRHFGGRQWYFRCPATQSRCSVLWMPPGARHVLQPSSLAQASRLRLSVCIPRGPGLSRAGENQIQADWESRS